MLYQYIKSTRTQKITLISLDDTCIFRNVCQACWILKKLKYRKSKQANKLQAQYDKSVRISATFCNLIS